MIVRINIPITASLFIAACAAAPTPSPTPARPTAAPATAAPTFAPVTIKMGQVGGLSDGAIFIADAKGYFKEQGITLDVTPFASAAQMITPLGTNELQVGGGAVSAGLLNAHGRGINIVIVADKGNLNPGNGYEAILVRKDLADTIKGPNDLKGRTIALSARDITPEVSLDTYLRTGGLTINDVNIATMGHPDMVTALQNKAIDVGVLIEPSLSRAIATGAGAILVRSDSIAPGEQTAVILYSERFAAQKGVATRWMVAYLKGARLYNDAFVKKDQKARAEVVDILSKATKLDAALFDSMYYAGIDPNGKVNADSLSDVQKYFIAKGSQQKAVDLAKLIDTSFADAAVQQLGAYK